jgi:hypothetical protein
VLLWLCFCARPATLEEIVEVLAVTFDGGPRFEPDRQYLDPRDILTRCSSLVSISGEGWLRLAHFSVKEYLVSEHIQSSKAHLYSVTEEHANISIAQTCLAYLLQDGTLNISTINNYPLALYAAKYWIKHACSQGDARLPELRSMIFELLQASKAHYMNWVQLYEYSKIKMAPPLYYTSLEGMTETTRLLLEKGANVNAQGGLYDNALQAASFGGHLAIVKLLLEKGVNRDSQSEQLTL